MNGPPITTASTCGMPAAVDCVDPRLERLQDLRAPAATLWYRNVDADRVRTRFDGQRDLQAFEDLGVRILGRALLRLGRPRVL